MYERDGEEYDDGEDLVLDCFTQQHLYYALITLSFVCQLTSLVVILLVDGRSNHTMSG